MYKPDTDWEAWKGALLTLRDEVFFDLMRNYLGELKTPFNKHNLVRDLTAKLSQSEFQTKILGSLDPEDLVALSSVDFLEDPTEEDLGRFLSGTVGWLDLHTRLLNLEERLLVYRPLVDKRRRLILSPLFKIPEFRQVLSPRVLFPVHSAEALKAPKPWLDDAHLMAVFSFLQEFPQPYGSGGQRKKKVQTEWEARFPLLAEHPGSTVAWTMTEHVLYRLGLAWKREEQIILHIPAWEELGRLEPLARRTLLWAAAAGPGPEVWRSAWKILPIFLQSLPEGEAMPEGSLLRWASQFRGLGPSWNQGLEALGVLVKNSRGDWQLHPGTWEEAPSSGSWGVLPPNFELTLRPEATLARSFPAVRLCRLKKRDTFCLYEVHKSAALSAFSGGMTAAQAQEVLRDVTGGAVSQNIAFSLDQWEKEFQSFRLFRGVVLVVSPDRVYAVENSPGYSAAVERVLGPGVFLVREEALDAWRKELLSLNLAVLPPVEEVRPTSPLGIPFLYPLPPAESGPLLRFPVGGVAVDRKADPDPMLASGLEAGSFTPEERAELEARIRRKLILSPEQLTKAAARGEKMEASALDYVGKIRLAEQALAAAGDLVEIIQRGTTGQPERRILRPTKVDRQGQEVILTGEEVESNQNLRVFVSRLSFLRRLRQSLFS